MIGTGTGEPQQRLRIEETIHRIWGPFWKGTGVFFAGRSASGMDERPRRLTAVSSLSRIRGNRKPRGLESAHGPDIARHVENLGPSFVARRAAAAVASLNRWRGMLRSAKRRRLSGSMSESASMKISTVSSLADLDTNRRVAKVDLVPSSVCSSYDGVGHYRLAFRGRRRYQTTFDRSRPQKQSNYGLERCGPLDQRR
jgi:hypothetical protein